MNLVINDQQVTFEAKDNQTFVTSRDIAAVFGKEHYNVLRDIEALPTDEFNRLNFEAVKYRDAKGEMRKAYRLTRDGFALLAMGFTGAKAYQWKIAFIDGFNKMEAELKNGGYGLPKTYVEALEQLLEKTKALEAAQPQIEFANNLQKIEDSISVSDFAKVLCSKSFPIGEKRLFKRLRDLGLLSANNKPYQKYLDMGIFTLKQGAFRNPNTGDFQFYMQTRIAVKGEEYLYQILTHPTLFSASEVSNG
jgi:anti-repressor protein